MFTIEQYRAKGAEYAVLRETARTAAEAREFGSLERSFAELASNAQWMNDNRAKTVQAPDNR